MIAKLYEYFGVTGLVSVAVWILAAALMGVYARRKRQGYCLLALGVAIAAVLLAGVNSRKVSAIRLDRRDELAAAQKAQREAATAAGESGSVGPVLQFAEGDPEEDLPAYRKQGKQVRDKKPGAAAPTVGTDEEEPEKEEPERFMRQEDLLAANRLDRINLMMVRLILLVAIGLVFWDYLAWFNATVMSRWPLPIGGKWLDNLSPRTRAVLVRRGADGRMTPAAYVGRMVRKGENFIYFGGGDPWSGGACARLKVWKWPLWTLPELVYGAPGIPQGSEFALDAAWFGRYGVVVSQAEVVQPFLADMADLLAELRDTGASARKTVHLVWDLSCAPEMEVTQHLIRMARDTNLKVAVWTGEPVPPEFAALFDEHIGQTRQG